MVTLILDFLEESFENGQANTHHNTMYCAYSSVNAFRINKCQLYIFSDLTLHSAVYPVCKWCAMLWILTQLSMYDQRGRGLACYSLKYEEYVVISSPYPK